MTAPVLSTADYMAAIPLTDPLDFGNRPGDGPLQSGGKPGDPAVMAGGGSDLPSIQSKAAQSQARALRMIRDVWLGTERIRERQVEYLPKAPGESQENYNSRLARSVFYNMLRHTIIGLVGFVFRKDPKLGADVPSEIVKQWENIDNAGTHGDVFAREMLQDDLTAGHCAILVDYPNTNNAVVPRMPNGQPTREADNIFRPFWVPIYKDNIMSWRMDTEDGKQVMTQLVLRETVMAPAGQFGEQEQTRYRVFQRAPGGVVTFRLLQVASNNSVMQVDEGSYPTQTEIPVAEITSSGSMGVFMSQPPLLDLAYLNVAHYQQWSDQATNLHLTCVPIFVTKGLNVNGSANPPMVLGPSGSVDLPPNGAAEYVSHSGQALQQVANAITALENSMAVLGIAMLATNKRVAETAEAKRIDKGSFDSALSVTARGLEDGLERALQFHANYLGLKSGGSIQINRDFENLTMQPDMLVAYVAAVAQAGLPVRVLTQAMQDGGLIGQDVDLDALDAEVMANAAAIQDQKEQSAKDALALAAEKAKGAPIADSEAAKAAEAAKQIELESAE